MRRQTSTYKLFYADILLLVAFLASCNAGVSADYSRSPACAAQDESCAPASLDLTFDIASIELTGENSFQISWEAAIAATRFDIIISTNEQCTDKFVEITDISANSQTVTLHGEGTFYACVYAVVDGIRYGASNNGRPLRKAEPVPSPTPKDSPAPEPSPTPKDTPAPEPSPSPEADNANNHINESPTLSFTFANADIALGSADHPITFAAADSDDNALISLYYRVGSSAGCDAAGLANWNLIVAGLQEDSASSHAWITTTLGAGDHYICGVIDDDDDEAVFALASQLIHINEPPVIAMTAPSIATTVGQTQSFNVTWTDSDADNNATVFLYASTSNAGDCSDGTLITDDPLENDDGGSGTFAWSLTNVAGASYYLCGVANDGVNTPVSSGWSSAQLTVNVAPTFAWVAPATALFTLPGSDFDLEWTVSDPDDDAQIQLSYGHSASATCTGYTALGTAISEDSGPTTYAFATTGASNIYYFCATITDDYNTMLVNSSSTSQSLTIYRPCTWAGNASNDWSDPNNWTNCNSTAPLATDRPIIPSGPANQPVLAADTTVAGIGEGVGGGTLTVNAGVHLYLTLAQKTIASSITFQGDSATCTSCYISPTTTAFFAVVNDATLTLLPGITIYDTGSYGMGYLQLGDGTEPGHLQVLGGALESEWPIISGGYSSALRVLGAPGNPSHVYIDGLRILDVARHNSFDHINFADHYQIDKLDRLTIDTATTSAFNNTRGFVLANCANGVFNDISWTDIKIVDGFDGGHNVVVATDCTGIGPIQITASGLGWGSPFASDPNNIFSWANDVSFTCTWTGNSSTLWNDADNWSNCTNGRSNFPSQHDNVIIPVTAIAPTVNENSFIKGFAAGTGGGTITIASGKYLALSTSTDQVLSDVTLQGDVASCSTCMFYTKSNLWVANDATLTLKTGLMMGAPNAAYVYLGNGASAGHLLAPNGGSSMAEWPRVGAYNYYFEGIRVLGAGPGQLSSIAIDGLKIVSMGAHNSNYVSLDLADYYQVDSLNRLSMANTFGGATKGRYIRARNCDHSLITDLTWEEMDFAAVSLGEGYNIDIASCASLGAGAITLTPATTDNLGYGEEYASDPEITLEWN